MQVSFFRQKGHNNNDPTSDKTITILASLKTEATDAYTPILGTFILYLETQTQTNSHAHSTPLPGDGIPVTGTALKHRR